MLKLVIGLLTYKIKNKKLYNEDLSKYPEGMKTLEGTLDFLGPLKGTIWNTFMMFISYF